MVKKDMLVPTLVTLAVILGAIMTYIYFIAPKFHPMKRAITYLNQNMIDEAIIELKKLLDKEPNNIAVHYKLSEIYFNINKIDQAVLQLEKIVSINNYTYEIEKLPVIQKLAEVYLDREELEKAFQTFLIILDDYPGDPEALYHAAFIALGQELFDMAERYFKSLTGKNHKSMEVLFGAGIACYMSQNTADAIDYFKEALAIEPHSDIANLAMAFTQQRKRDYKTAANYVKMVIDSSSDETALFVAKRFLAILYVQSKKAPEAVKILEDLLDYSRKHEMYEEISTLLYDLGFAALSGEMTEQAYQYWNELYQHDLHFKDVQSLTTNLRKEMDIDMHHNKEVVEGSVVESIEGWLENTFPESFIWDICGLRSNQKINMQNIHTSVRVPTVRDSSISITDTNISYDANENLERFKSLNVEDFRIISNRLLVKAGYRVDDILPTYREADGVDFLAQSLAEKIRTLVWVRRWKDTRIGDIQIRNFAQAVNDAKAKKGLFITATEMTGSGEAALKGLSKVTVIHPEELGSLLSGLV